MMRVTLLCLLLLLAGCSGDTQKASLVTYARVLGVRVEVVDDVERATPRIDEAARARVLVAGPAGPVEVNYAVALCVASTRNDSVPACDGAALVATTSTASTESPELSWPGLDADDVRDANELLLLGTICEQGTAVANPMSAGECENPSSLGVSFVGHLTLLDADESNINHHPSFAAAQFSFDDAAWTHDECGMTVKGDGADHDIAVALIDSAREQVDGVNEELLLSWFTTQGAIDAHFSVLEREQTEEAQLHTTWTAPKLSDTPSDARATFTIVLRDQRGGTAWTTRTVCFE